MIVQLNEVANLTSEMVPYGMGRFGVSEQAQRIMLTAFLNVAEAGIKARADLAAQGLNVPINLPPVVITYSKVTKAKPRLAGEHFRGMPGVATDTHTGNVIKVARNKLGKLYFTLADNNRAGDRPGFTAVRLEGIRTFAFVNNTDQQQALAAANVALAT